MAEALDDSRVVVFRDENADVRIDIESVHSDEPNTTIQSETENEARGQGDHNENEQRNLEVALARFDHVVNDRLSNFENKLDRLQRLIEDGANQNQNRQTEVGGRDNSPIIRESGDLICPRRGQAHSTPRRNGTPQPNFQLDQELFPLDRHSSANHCRMKPQTYDGTDDLDEYLAQFNILSEINGWSYNLKSLYLAGSLTGSARALLNDLDRYQQRDYQTLVEALNNRFGSINRAEIFRSKLQTRIKEKNESIPEVAQAIKKLTRKAYPGASNDLVDTLALDYFIDAIPDQEIRLRLREVGPRTTNEAEKIAVRLEAHRVADRQRGRYVRSLESSDEGKSAGVKFC